MRRRVQVRKGSGLKTPQMRTLILQISQDPLIHHVTHAVMTMNRLLICFKNFRNFRNLVQCLCLVYCFGGWVGGWLSNPPPPPPRVGEGQFWIPGFSQILGGWVSEFTPPPPLDKHIPAPLVQRPAPAQGWALKKGAYFCFGLNPPKNLFSLRTAPEGPPSGWTFNR